MEQLKKCPFCGGEAVLHVEDGIRVICRECCATSKCLVDGYSNGKPNGSAWKAVVKAWNTRKPMARYEELERELQSVYGECDGLLEAVVDGVVERLIKHEGVQFEKLNKAYLLTDENVDKWNRLKGAMERIVERLEDNSFWTEPTYDMDGHSNEDETEVINLQKAIEIVKEEM